MYTQLYFLNDKRNIKLKKRIYFLTAVYSVDRTESLDLSPGGCCITEISPDKSEA
jgi:hypothetical protein